MSLLETPIVYPQCSTLVIIQGELERQHCQNRVVPGLTICSQCVERKFSGRRGNGAPAPLEYVARTEVRVESQA